MAKELPKAGTSISIKKFHVSPMNARYGEPFGEAEEDKNLIAQLKHGEIIQPMRARLESDGYGVYVGGRRLQAEKAVGTKEFVVGKDVIIADVNDEDALEASWIENLRFFRKDMNPVTRAEKLNELLASSTIGLRGKAREWGIPPSTLVDWLKPLELSPGMQKAVSDGHVCYTDGLHVARMELGQELQNKLATVAETEGTEAFRKELGRVKTGRQKRGLPKDTYLILRTNFDKRYRPDMELWETINKLAEAKEMELDAFNKFVLKEHITNNTV